MRTSVDAANRHHVAPVTSRAAGLAGLVFLVMVVVENVLRGAPVRNDAEMVEVFEFYAKRGAGLVIAHGLFFVTIPLLLTYASGMFRRVRGGPHSEVPARVGWVAASVMVATFGMVVALDAVSTHLSRELSRTPAAMQVLFTLHAAVFSLNGAVLGTAMIGFGIAAWNAGTDPVWQCGIAIAGGTLLVLAAIPLVAVLEGSPVRMLGLIGFGAWLFWVGATSIRMIREH